jgi:hypothetical protein
MEIGPSTSGYSDERIWLVKVVYIGHTYMMRGMLFLADQIKKACSIHESSRSKTTGAFGPMSMAHAPAPPSAYTAISPHNNSITPDSIQLMALKSAAVPL